MLQTVKDACKFDPKAIDYALSDQIEKLEDLIGHDAKAGKAFFDKTYITGGMKTLLRQGLQRLAGTSSQAVFELKQAMGGGKTHSMLALGYLAATGTSDDVDVGWRKAIRIAMTENPTGDEVGAIRAKNPRRPEDRPTLPLFERVK
ncbi:hypothetical protein AOQ71_12410 [Bradyrhizobium manausense]|uniref:Uncharacterized protein n=2 Tax=Bradyrhizobium manausense TaxID=989370 RepID=A0A0R3DXR3_9BRAD|nr:hypothetical protein AOQ71_12410 [Bradyrhizobium manausense]